MPNPSGRGPQVPDGIVAIDPAQAASFPCECGSTIFILEESYSVIYDRINPRHVGLIPKERALVCKGCKKSIPADASLEAAVMTYARKIVTS